jgi:hypothetical protein
MSAFAFDIRHYPQEPWTFELARCDDGSAYWLAAGPFHFLFGRELSAAPFTLRAAVEALREWARPALRRLSVPLRIVGAAAMGTAAVAIGLLFDVVLRLRGLE